MYYWIKPHLSTRHNAPSEFPPPHRSFLHVPDYGTLVIAGLVGSLGYGLSLVLFILALRHIGTARTGAYYSTAPFIGVAIAVLLSGEPLTVNLTIAAALMALRGMAAFDRAARP